MHSFINLFQVIILQLISDKRMFKDDRRSVDEIYSIGKQTGMGGYGQVYAATSRNTGENVMIKAIEKRTIRKWEKIAKRKIPLEVTILYRLKEVKGVIKLIDYIEEAQFLFIIMEQIPMAMDLFAYMELSGPVEEELAKHIFKQTTI